MTDNRPNLVDNRRPYSVGRGEIKVIELDGPIRVRVTVFRTVLGVIVLQINY